MGRRVILRDSFESDITALLRIRTAVKSDARRPLAWRIEGGRLIDDVIKYLMNDPGIVPPTPVSEADIPAPKKKSKK